MKVRLDTVLASIFHMLTVQPRDSKQKHRGEALFKTGASCTPRVTYSSINIAKL